MKAVYFLKISYIDPNINQVKKGKNMLSLNMISKKYSISYFRKAGMSSEYDRNKFCFIQMDGDTLGSFCRILG